MALSTIRCFRCKHVGVAVLPCMAACSECGAVRYFRMGDGRRIVAPDLDAFGDDATDAAVVEDDASVVEQQPRARGRPRKATAASASVN
jgi:hypothetical protein